MGRHQSAASSRRARVALGALPLVATVGAIGVGSVVMSPASSDAPLGPPSVGGGAGAPAAALPLGPGLAPAPVTVLDLAATDGSVTPQGVPGSTIGGVRPGSGGSRGDDAPASGRATRSGATAGGGEVARVSSVRDAGTPARGVASGGGSTGSTGGGGGGGGADDGGSGGGSGWFRGFWLRRRRRWWRRGRRRLRGRWSGRRPARRRRGRPRLDRAGRDVAAVLRRRRLRGVGLGPLLRLLSRSGSVPADTSTDNIVS